MTIDIAALKHFSPLHSLSRSSLNEVARIIEVRVHPPGHTLFRRGDRDNLDYFLIAGELQLLGDSGSAPKRVLAGSEASRHPLANVRPRPVTAVAQSTVTVASIDQELLDNLVMADQTTAYEVTELVGCDPEWMFQLLQTPAFQRLPAGKLASLFARLEEVAVQAGQTVIRQGEPGDYYYFIHSGRARITRRIGSDDGQDLVLAEIGPGETFGEEALLSGDPRNATVSMLSDGVLMRLSAADFDAILRPPLVQWVNVDEASHLVREGATLIDVRLEDEFKRGSLPGASNLPLYLLRLKAKALESRRKHIVFCQTGRRSQAAAFLLSQRGLDVHVLKGGLNSLPSASQGAVRA